MKEYSLEWWEDMRCEEVDIDDNICECGKWVVGKHRCVCGGRRIYLDDMLCDGTWYTPAAD